VGKTWKGDELEGGIEKLISTHLQTVAVWYGDFQVKPGGGRYSRHKGVVSETHQKGAE